MTILTDNNLLKEMGEEVHKINVANGWFEKDRTFGDDIALLHSEVTEALEAFREGGLEDQTKLPPRGFINEEDVPLRKPEGVGSEAADIFIRLLDFCKRYELDLFYEWRRKLDFNKTRGYKHGGENL